MKVEIYKEVVPRWKCYSRLRNGAEASPALGMSLYEADGHYGMSEPTLYDIERSSTAQPQCHHTILKWVTIP